MEEIIREVLLKLEIKSINRFSLIQSKYSKLINESLWNRKLTLPNNKSIDSEVFVYCFEKFHSYNLIKFLIQFSSTSKAIELIKKHETNKSAIKLVETYNYNNIQLFEFFSSITTNKQKFYCKALINAASNGHLEVVKLLLDRGADIHIHNDKAIRNAALEGRLEVVEFLLDKEANIHARDDESLRFAASNGHLEVVKLLLDRGADIHAYSDQALRNAAFDGHLETVKFLLDRGADIHAENELALRFAAGDGHLEIVKLLLDRGADIHARNDEALRNAAEEGHLDVLSLLLDRGADIHAGNDEVLRNAAEEGHLELLQLLLDRGANIDKLKHIKLSREIENYIKKRKESIKQLRKAKNVNL